MFSFLLIYIAFSLIICIFHLHLHLIFFFFQSQWKGYLVRRKIKDARLKEARERIEAANKKVTESMKLCNRTRSALDYLLKVKNLSTVYEALQQLGESTFYWFFSIYIIIFAQKHFKIESTLF